MSSIPRLFILFLCVLLLTPTAFARRGKGKGPGGNRPQGNGDGKENRPQGNGGGKENRPQGNGGRGPPGIGVFAINGAEEPTLLSTIAKGSQPTMAVRGGNIVAVYQNHSRDETTGVPQLVMSTSTDGGNTWSDEQLVTISGLPADITVTINPTLSSDGNYLYFTGAAGKNLKKNATAIYAASYAGGSSFSNAVKVFSMDGAAMMDSAVANGLMIVPHRGEGRGGKNEFEDPSDESMLPTIARKLLRRKPGRKPHRGSDSAYLATCSTPTSCTFAQNITMPEQNVTNSFVGSMLYTNGVYEFYGSGPGPWPVTSSDGTKWDLPVTGENLKAHDPSVIVYNGSKLAATPVKHSKMDAPGGSGQDDATEDPILV